YKKFPCCSAVKLNTYISSLKHIVNENIGQHRIPPFSNTHFLFVILQTRQVENLRHVVKVIPIGTWAGECGRLAKLDIQNTMSRLEFALPKLLEMNEENYQKFVADLDKEFEECRSFTKF